MRIIDKQHDFYDYLQDPSDKLVFDRRGSFLLTKEIFCERISTIRYYRQSKYRFVLLQCGATFWLLLVTITKWDNEYKPSSYTMELLTTWKNYDKKRELLSFELITIRGIYGLYEWRNKEFNHERIMARVADLKTAIIHDDFNVENCIGNYAKVTSVKGGFIREEKSFPILKACGIGNLIEPIEMFCAIEEFFSLQKTDSERTEAIGSTNDDKIVMHGFDTKTSFRGKT